jgi:hypothetical protein
MYIHKIYIQEMNAFIAAGYDKDHVSTFFKQMGNVQPKTRMDKFSAYHTKAVLNKFMVDIWPPPSIWELWNRWNSLPAGEQDVYVKNR